MLLLYRNLSEDIHLTDHSTVLHTVNNQIQMITFDFSKQFFYRSNYKGGNTKQSNNAAITFDVNYITLVLIVIINNNYIVLIGKCSILKEVTFFYLFFKITLTANKVLELVHTCKNEIIICS